MIQSFRALRFHSGLRQTVRVFDPGLYGTAKGVPSTKEGGFGRCVGCLHPVELGYGEAERDCGGDGADRGNVFADLGLPNAEELGTKVRLAASLNAILARRKMTQAEAARVLGVNQPKVSALKGYKLEGFSVERLMHFVTALEHDVVIEIRPRAREDGVGDSGTLSACEGGWGGLG